MLAARGPSPSILPQQASTGHSRRPGQEPAAHAILICQESDRAELTVHFAIPRPKVLQLAGLRQHLAGFREVPSAEAFARADSAGRIVMSDLYGPEARCLAELLSDAGLRVELGSTSKVMHQPPDRATGAVLLIEDDVEATRLAQEMIRTAVPVERIVECCRAPTVQLWSLDPSRTPDPVTAGQSILIACLPPPARSAIPGDEPGAQRLC
jgi:hypothetical protein